jgi:hypothetical protein
VAAATTLVGVFAFALALGAQAPPKKAAATAAPAVPAALPSASAAEPIDYDAVYRLKEEGFQR